MKVHPIVLTLILGISTAAYSDQAVTVPGPESLAVLSPHSLKYKFCPTDLFPSENQAQRLMVGASLAACVPGILVCAGASVIGIVGAAINQGFENRIGDAAKSACAQIPDTVAVNERAHWQTICEIVVDSANRNALTIHDGLVPTANAPLNLSDPVLSWNLNGQPVEQVEALRLARDRLRDAKYPVCYSDPEMQNTLKQNTSISLGKLVNLTFANIKKHGSRFFYTPHNDFLRYTHDDEVVLAKHYLYSRMQGEINEFDGLSDGQWTTLVEMLPLGFRYEIRDVDHAAKNVVQESYNP